MAEPNQAESHSSRNMWYVLKEMISMHKNGEKFSDSTLSKKIRVSPRTIQRIKKKLIALKIIEQDSKTYPNNEKFYSITDLRKAKEISKRAYAMHDRNFLKRMYGKYYVKYGIHIPSEILLTFNDNTQNKKHSKQIKRNLFLRNICPICTKKTLRDYTKGEKKSLIDRRCNKCRYTFLYRIYPASILAIKY